MASSWDEYILSRFVRVSEDPAEVFETSWTGVGGNVRVYDESRGIEKRSLFAKRGFVSREHMLCSRRGKR